MIDFTAPRYMCIADYPKSIYHIGTVINAGGSSGDLIYCDDKGPRLSMYPHLFRLMDWHEGRELKDMPEYVLCFLDGKSTNTIHVDGTNVWWDLHPEHGYFGLRYKTGGGTLIGYLKPCSREQYLAHVKF